MTDDKYLCKIQVVLTDRQERVLSAVLRLTAHAGFPPTMRELADDLGMSVNGVRDHLKLLKKKGCVTWDHGKSRTLKVAGQPGYWRMKQGW